MDIKKEANKPDDETVEIIQLDIENDNRDEDNKVKLDIPKTAKDLFSDFKPDSGSEFDNDDDDSDDDEFDDEPLSKRIKRDGPLKTGRKRRDSKSNGTANNKKVIIIDIREIKSMKLCINCFYSICKNIKKNGRTYHQLNLGYLKVSMGKLISTVNFVKKTINVANQKYLNIWLP